MSRRSEQNAKTEQVVRLLRKYFGTMITAIYAKTIFHKLELPRMSPKTSEDGLGLKEERNALKV